MDNKFDIDAALAGLKSGQDLMGKDGVLTPLIKQLTEAAELLSNLVFEISGSCSDPIVLCGFNTVFEFNASDNFGQIIKAS